MLSYRSEHPEVGEHQGRGGALGFCFSPGAEGPERSTVNLGVDVFIHFPSLCSKPITTFLAEVGQCTRNLSKSGGGGGDGGRDLGGRQKGTGRGGLRDCPLPLSDCGD